ncbi:hypothetical protein LZ31DRAFT_548096 [Colletotrichum somersetense]|nr:hypothetical protein LZ31DRAFT_548096 [Colletotrichum somersetense]
MCVDAFRSWSGEPGGLLPTFMCVPTSALLCGLFSPNIGHRPLSRPRFRTKCPTYLPPSLPTYIIHMQHDTGPRGLNLLPRLPPKLEPEPLAATYACK